MVKVSDFVLTTVQSLVVYLTCLCSLGSGSAMQAVYVFHFFMMFINLAQFPLEKKDVGIIWLGVR